MQRTPSSNSRAFVALEAAGDAVCHTYKLRHGVEVAGGTRYSLVSWWKPTEAECFEGTATWCGRVLASRSRARPSRDARGGRYNRAAARGDADACYNQCPRNPGVFRFFSTLEARISVNLGPIRLLFGPLIISARVLEI